MNDESGFTIVETAFAAMIMLVVLTGVMTGVIFAAQAGPQAALSDAATNLANQTIEQARNLPFDSVGVTYANGTMGSPPGVLPAVVSTGNLTMNTAVTWVYDSSTNRAAYKQVTVTVSWTKFMGGNVRVTSYVYGHTYISGAGDLQTNVYDADTMRPVQGCSIAVTPKGQQAQYGSTNPSGTILFGYIAAGSAAITVTPPAGYIVDPAAPTSATIVSASYVQKTIFLEKPSVQTIQVTDSSTSLPIVGATVTCSGYGNPGALTTDSNGNAVFNNLFHAPSQASSFTVTVTSSNYSSAVTSFTIAAEGSNQTTNVSLTRSSALAVTAVDASKGNAGLSGATVAVTLGGVGVSGSPQVTGSSGLVSFVLGAGSYQVTATESNYATATASAGVSSGATSTVTVPLSLWGNWTITVTSVDVRYRQNYSDPNIKIDMTGTDIDGNAIAQKSITTNSSATGSFTGLVAGTYTLWADGSKRNGTVQATVNYTNSTVSVTVTTSD